jgi:hypothetical protein
MRQLFLSVVFCLTLASSTARAQNFHSGAGGDRLLVESRIQFVLSNINEQIVEEFRGAWRQSAFGSNETEALVLMFRHPDGALKAVSAGRSKQAYKFSFVWNAAIIALVHTHPNKCNPRPGEEDILVARRFWVPIFTITRSGMYVYDPDTGRITMVKSSLDWLDSSSWRKN